MDNITLKSIFASNKDELSKKLSCLTLPKDSEKIQTEVSDFLGRLFEKNGLYRQKLNEQEDFILQAALELLQTQQRITEEVVTSIKGFRIKQQESAQPNPKKGMRYTPILGTGIGAVAGGFLGTWWAVGGAIAGTAIAIYCSTKINKSSSTKDCHNVTIEKKINVEIFSDIIEKVCERIDNLMLTYRTQVKRVENKYTQIEKPSLLTECSILFEQISNVNKVLENNKEQIPSKVVSAIEMLVESLENYGLTIKDGKIVSE